MVPSPKFQLREAMVPSLSVELSVKFAVRPLVVKLKFADRRHVAATAGSRPSTNCAPVAPASSQLLRRVALLPPPVQDTEMRP